MRTLGNKKWKCCMGSFLRKSTFCPKLTQTLDWEETDTHYGQSRLMANEGIWPQKMSNSMHGIKSATLEIANSVLLSC